MNDRRESLGRREFVSGLALLGTTALYGFLPEPAAAEPPPETTKLRLLRVPSVCLAPQYVAEELLKAEGFTDVEYVPPEGRAGSAQMFAAGRIDFYMDGAPALVLYLDQSVPIIIVAGVHVGCYDLFASEWIRSIRDLRGKTVAVTTAGRRAFVASMAAHVGLDPRTDIKFVELPSTEGMRQFAEGKVDAFLGFPPEPLELRAKKIGHVIVSTLTDRPWSQYFCCMLAGNRDFVRRHPVATKRALRAILKATTLCTVDPDRVSQFLVDKGYATRYEDTLQTLKAIPYGKWRDYDPSDTLRFYALRLHEAGMIKSSPQKILAQGTDWRSRAQSSASPHSTSRKSCYTPKDSPT